MGQIYYSVEKMVGGMWHAATAADLGKGNGDGTEPEPEFETEAEAVAAVQGASGKGGKGAKGEAAEPVGTFQVVQKLRLAAGSYAPSGPVHLDSPFVVKGKAAGEAAKKARDERRKEEDAEFERTGRIAENREVPVREISGSPMPIGRQDRITSAADPGAGARYKATDGKPEAPASRK